MWSGTGSCLILHLRPHTCNLGSLMGLIAVAFLICTGVAVVEWTRALINRAPGVSLFSPRLMFGSGFTAEGRKHRRRFFQASLAGVVLVLATLVYS